MTDSVTGTESKSSVRVGGKVRYGRRYSKRERGQMQTTRTLREKDKGNNGYQGIAARMNEGWREGVMKE